MTGVTSAIALYLGLIWVLLWGLVPTLKRIAKALEKIAGEGDQND